MAEDLVDDDIVMERELPQRRACWRTQGQADIEVHRRVAQFHLHPADFDRPRPSIRGGRAYVGEKVFLEGGAVFRNYLFRCIKQRLAEAELKLLEGQDQFGVHGSVVEIEQYRRVGHRMGRGRDSPQQRAQQRKTVQAAGSQI